MTINLAMTSIKFEILMGTTIMGTTTKGLF